MLSRTLAACLRKGNDLSKSSVLAEQTKTRYAATNGEFHALIVEAAHNHAVSAARRLNDRIPLVAPGTVVFDAESLMKEHTHLSKESLNMSADRLHLIAHAAPRA
ncbi:hypothetical protein [Paraburkholderia sp. J12]|uniref:hypothetical protein n=1 Tax=Paraburkholderia sp. J12 TaxID=2805432 RepID=UPI002ABD753F|nr:hypothetical protein [Paraburkholderia sp. J12]